MKIFETTGLKCNLSKLLLARPVSDLRVLQHSLSRPTSELASQLFAFHNKDKICGADHAVF